MDRHENKRIFLYVPDGIGVRNYLYSDLISHIKLHTLGMYHRLPQFIIETVEQLQDVKIEQYQLPVFVESKYQRFLRDLATFSRLMRNSRIKKNYRIWKSLVLVKNPKGVMKIYYLAIQCFSWFFSLHINCVDAIDNLLEKSYERSKYAQSFSLLLQQSKPDVILCTHQRVPAAALMAVMARRLKIPMATAIFSWDNLPKSRITLKADRYIVWSSYMQKEMSEYYPTIPHSKVQITGTPQFECYKKTDLYLPKDKFLKTLGLPFNKKLILLSGNDMTSPNDHYYFEDIAEAVLQLAPDNRPHLILRRAPVDASDRFKDFAIRYKSILTVIDPLWTKGNDASLWSEILPTYSDVSLLTNLCLHSDLVVNIGSTMGLDFAHFDKPAIYINYHKPYNRSWYDIEFIYGLEHFRTLDGLDAVMWIRSKEEIVDVLRKGIETPMNVARDRAKWKFKLTNDISNASATIAKLLVDMAKNSGHNN